MMKKHHKYLLLIIFLLSIAFNAISQESKIEKASGERNDKQISVYAVSPVFLQHWGKLANINFEILLFKKSRIFNPAFSLGFGLEFSKYGLETYAIPFEFKLVMSNPRLKIETGAGITILDPDVMINTRFGVRVYLFNSLFLRLAYTPYFFVPYGDREYNEPYIEIKSDVSVGIGYRFGKPRNKVKGNNSF